MQTDNRPLLYSHYDVTFQEVPGEVSLIFDITGCPHHCPDCHSKFLWDYYGKPLLEDLPKIIGKYYGMVTCVCFMGGDQNKQELLRACEIVRYAHLKTCLYSGLNISEFYNYIMDSGPRCFSTYLNYIKLGPYNAEFGGLDKPTTNQRFYKVHYSDLIDMTYLFQKEYK